MSYCPAAVRAGSTASNAPRTLPHLLQAGSIDRSHPLRAPQLHHPKDQHKSRLTGSTDFVLAPIGGRGQDIPYSRSGALVVPIVIASLNRSTTMQLHDSSQYRHTRSAILIMVAAAWCTASRPCPADVITDWDTKASAVASPAALGQPEQAIVDLSMFDAVNSLARKYHAYLASENGFDGASPEAAAARAAATALAKLHPQNAPDFKAALDEYVMGLSAAHDAIANGMRLGELAALRVVELRAADNATGDDASRPRTKPGLYVPTATMVASTWKTIRPFVLEHPNQFRPGPPVALT